MDPSAPRPTTVVVASDPMSLIDISASLQALEPTTFRSFDAAVAHAETDAGAVIIVGEPETRDLIASGAIHDHRGLIFIGVVSRLDNRVLTAAMAAGFADLAVSDDLAELPALVSRVASRPSRATISADERQSPPGRLVVVTSCRAGQGATTVAVNIAVGLARTHRVFLVEGDPRFGDLIDSFTGRSGLGDQRPSTLVRSPLFSEGWVADFVRQDVATGVHMVVPPRKFGDVVDPDAMIGVITELQDMFDVLVMDVPVWVLEQYPMHRVADATLVVASDGARDPYRVRALREMLGMNAGGADLVVQCLTGQVKPDKLKKASGLPLLATLPFDSATASARSIGRPLLEAAPRSSLAKALERLTATIDSRFTDTWGS